MKQTPLHALHLELGARMVEFGGYEMPVQYPAGIIGEHLHTRDKAGLFDVSHMGQVLVRGPGAALALERVMPADLQLLMPGRQVYSMLTNAEGGVIDDLIVTRWADDAFALVVNAGNKDAVLAYLRDALPELELTMLEDRALLALQGPAAVDVLAGILPGVEALTFLGAMHVALDGHDGYVARAGYTGEDGFELSLPATLAADFARRLLADARVAPVGLGARDSLRLEAGLCLYGHDLDPVTTPVEAGLSWVIAPARRPGGERAGGYPGADMIGRELLEGPRRRRIGLRGEGKAPVREGSELFNAAGERVGTVSSGGYGPSVGGVIAMAYVDHGQPAPDTAFDAMVRGRARPMRCCRLPFVPARYHRV